MQQSSMERRIHDVLTEADVDFIEEYIFDDLVSSSGRHLRFDFCVFDDNGNIDYLIEAQGKQHYQPVGKFGGSRGLYRQNYNDNLKRQYCLKNNLTLITIPYFEADRISYPYILRKVGYL